MRKNLIILMMYCFMLVGCASSEVSRDAASNMDMGVQNAKNLVGGASNSSIIDSYQNSSQLTKGALLGGATGAIAGTFTSIGVLPLTATGAILGASYGSYIDSKTTLKDKLDNQGINIVVLGDQILIVIPSSRLFQGMSAELKSEAYDTLALVTRYINQYVKMLVKITAYTNNVGSDRVNTALSQQQAEKVEKILLLDGIDARVLYAQGADGANLMTRNSYEDWDNDNYRIEITLEKLYV